MAMILLKTEQEELALFALIDEFASKVQMNRKGQGKDQNWIKYLGVIGYDIDTCSGDRIYEIAMPENYVKFMCFLIRKKFQ
jgi:hypothetical protein